MYSEKFEKVYETFQNKYYNIDIKIPKRKLKNLQNDHNDIGIIKFPDNYEKLDKELCWLITSAGIKFNRIYLILPNIEKSNTFDLFKFNQLITLFSDIVTVSDKPEIDLIKKHKQDDIYILNPNIIYNSLNIPYQYGTNTVFNLHKDLIYNKKHSYYNSCLQYNIHDDTEYYKNTIVTEPDIKNILLPDFYIPANTIKNDLIYDYKLSLVSNLYYYFFMHDIKIYYLENTMYNLNIDLNTYDSELLTLISTEKDQAKIDKWYFNYPKYKASDLIVKSVDKIIDLVFVSYVAPETIIESLTNLKKIFNFKIRDIYILDNVKENNYENHVYLHHDRKLLNYPNIKVLYNNIDQLFKRTLPTKEELNTKKFGQTLFDESLAYITNTSTADYVVILNDKIILNNEIVFDPDVILNSTSKYINIFNLEQMKQNKINYTTMDEFKQKVKEAKLEIKTIDLHNQILLPEDFDKYASVIFRVANTRGQILYNYLLDTYNYRLINYEDYNRWNSEL